MSSRHDGEKPWKTDLGRRSAQRREKVMREVEDAINQAPSFEDALRQAVRIMKERFARYSAVTAYVADGEDLALHTSMERPPGPDRIWSGGGPLAEAARDQATTVLGDLGAKQSWATVGLTAGSVMIAPVRTEAGLWAVLEVWSEFRDAFTPHDIKLMNKAVTALAHRTPAS